MLSITVLLIFNGVFEVNSQCLTTLIVTGIAQTPISALSMKERIEKTNCTDGTSRKAIIINVYFGITSTTPLWAQLKLHQDVIYPIFEQYPEGVHIICFSQGTIIVRALIQETDNHRVRNVISAAGLHMGISKLPLVPIRLTTLRSLTNNIKPENLWLACYNEVAQNTISICNYYRDEKNFNLYLKENIFLPIINNEIPHSKSEKYKINLQKIKKLVLLAGPDDGMIIPWQSGIFGSKSADGVIVNMEDQPIYKNDILGLKALNEKGAVIKHVIPNAIHGTFLTDENIFNHYILPYLD